MNRKVFSRSFQWCYFHFFSTTITVKFWLSFASFLCHGFVSNRTHLQHGPLEPPWNFVSECLFQKNFLPHPWPPERFLWVLTFPFFAVFLRPCFCFLLMQPNRAFRSFAIEQSIFGCARERETDRQTDRQTERKMETDIQTKNKRNRGWRKNKQTD